MKNKFKALLLVTTGSLFLTVALAQNVSLNMLVLNSGVVPLGGNGSLQATLNVNTGTTGQNTPVAPGKLNVQVTVPPSLLIAATQNNLPAGWAIRNNNGTVINLCNSSTAIDVNTAVDLLIVLQGVTSTTGSPTISGQLSFKTNCTAPGSLSGDNPSDNSSQAGFSVAGVVPVSLTNFTATLKNCQPVLSWTTENEINSSHFAIQSTSQNSSEWKTIGTVPAQGSTSAKTQYNFADNSTLILPEVKMLYRLKIIDYSGRYSYSAILPVFINCKAIQLLAYPNPVQNGNLYISITGLNRKTEVDLISLAGQVVLKQFINNGTNTMNVSTITPGEYILRINPESGIYKKVNVYIHR